MRVAVVGTRGIPGLPGGVERHCEELYPRLAALGVDVTVYARSDYIPETMEWHGVHVVPLGHVRGKGIEALSHTLGAVLRSASTHPEILHIHSVGPAAFAPLGKVLGMRSVVTVHARDHLQAKWGRLGKAYLRAGERIGVRRADAVIAVSRGLTTELASLYRREVVYIPNGPAHISRVMPGPVLKELGVAHGGYVLFVGRLIPDKRVEDLARACAASPELRLVVVGDSSDTDEYARGLKSEFPSVIFAGTRVGEELAELYSNAGAYALPSAVEGLPLSLIEAMGYGLPGVASDISANVEVLGEFAAEAIYPLGDAVALRRRLDTLLALDPSQRASLSERMQRRVRQEYDWDAIAGRTLEVYRSVLGQ